MAYVDIKHCLLLMTCITVTFIYGHTGAHTCFHVNYTSMYMYLYVQVLHNMPRAHGEVCQAYCYLVCGLGVHVLIVETLLLYGYTEHTCDRGDHEVHVSRVGGLQLKTKYLDWCAFVLAAYAHQLMDL